MIIPSRATKAKKLRIQGDNGLTQKVYSFLRECDEMVQLLNDIHKRNLTVIKEGEPSQSCVRRILNGPS